MAEHILPALKDMDSQGFRSCPAKLEAVLEAGVVAHSLAEDIDLPAADTADFDERAGSVAVMQATDKGRPSGCRGHLPRKQLRDRTSLPLLGSDELD